MWLNWIVSACCKLKRDCFITRCVFVDYYRCGCDSKVPNLFRTLSFDDGIAAHGIIIGWSSKIIILAGRGRDDTWMWVVTRWDEQVYFDWYDEGRERGDDNASLKDVVCPERWFLNWAAIKIIVIFRTNERTNKHFMFVILLEFVSRVKYDCEPNWVCILLLHEWQQRKILSLNFIAVVNDEWYRIRGENDDEWRHKMKIMELGWIRDEMTSWGHEKEKLSCCSDCFQLTTCLESEFERYHHYWYCRCEIGE